MSEAIRLSAHDLSKRYTNGSSYALRHFSYEFGDGVYGLLGPNGAGKSTLMNMIVGNLKPTAGSVLSSRKLSLIRILRKPVFTSCKRGPYR